MSYSSHVRRTPALLAHSHNDDAHGSASSDHMFARRCRSLPNRAMTTYTHAPCQIAFSTPDRTIINAYAARLNRIGTTVFGHTAFCQRTLLLHFYSLPCKLRAHRGYWRYLVLFDPRKGSNLSRWPSSTVATVYITIIYTCATCILVFFFFYPISHLAM